MEIPPDQRLAARAFVQSAREIKSTERRMIRGDVVSLVVLCLAIGVNGVNTLAGGFFGGVSIVIVALLSFVAGIKFVRVTDRRESYRAMVESADQVEMALAFHDLDDAS